ncbi:caspase family protein [Myxococcus stipitatus]|uniref:caspase family protein n=1 Tax=Myxococcus stipitatus TaxID=83455 RepID=UPI001F40816A|nr:caspase family protein [Myxococcus stipitatus]MCE9673087.1 caspase family protein [Myxococcus stipitatus]
MTRRSTARGWGRVLGTWVVVGLALVCLESRAARRPEEPEAALRRFALVVGSSEGGPGRERLRYAGSDALAISRVLEELGGVAPADRVLLLEADRDALLTALERLKVMAEGAVTPGLRRELVVYYSGHSDADGLLPRGERLSYDDLRRLLGHVPVDVRIAILDSCGSGALTRYKGGLRRPSFLTDVSSQVRGHAYLASSSADEVAQESDTIGASFFTHFLVTGLRGAADTTGDGRVTLHEAYQFAFHETLARTERSQGGPQHAAYDIQLAGSGDLVMTDLRGTPARMLVAEDVQGRLFVRDWGNQLVAELQKPAGRRLSLGLEVGRYHVTLERPSQRFEAEVTVSTRGAAELRVGDFVPVTLTRTAARGGSLHADAPVLPREPLAARADMPTVFLNLSLVPPLSTASLWGGSSLNHMALGGLAVRSLQLRGLGAAGGIGWVDGTMEGGQVAGLANVAGGEVLGAQLALGGNLAFGGATGAQLAAVINYSEQDFTGLQLGGVGNRSDARMSGFQFAGGVNMVERLTGAQLGIFNLAGSVSGAQVGLINVAGNVRGVQLGVINIADDVSVPIGVLSLVRKGRIAFEIGGDEVTPLFVGVKYGSQTVHVTASIGGDSWKESWRTFKMLGVGLHLPFGMADRYYLDVDFTTGGWQPELFGEGVENSLYRLRASIGWELKRRFALFGGVSLNAYHPPEEDPDDDVTWVPQWKTGRGPSGTRMWPGFLLGVRI